MKRPQKFCPSSTYNFTQPCNVRKRVEYWPNFLAFSEYLNFKAGARGASTSARAAFVSVLVLWQRKYFWQSPLNYSRLSWNCSATVVCIIIRTEEIIHFNKTVARISFLSKLWYFQYKSKQKVPQFWKKRDSRNCLLKMNGL